MNTLTRTETKGRSLNQKRDMWLALNKGILSRIAEEFGVSRPFVTDIYRDRRSSSEGLIEARLAQLGAPGFNTTKAA